MDIFTTISLCSGYEGLGLGLKRAIPNLRTICYVENEAYAIANLVAKIKEKRLDDAPIWDDLKTFDPKPFTGLVDIIHSGYPCQPFSIAGKRKGTDDPRHLWPHIERVIEAVRPIWFFGENVAGHLALGFPEVYRSLRNLGYKVEAGLFTAAECGAPHKRQRLFILAYNENSRFTRGNLSIRQPQRQKQTKINSLWIGKMADTESQGFATSQQSRNEKARPRFADQDSYGMWPSRPGQPQYEWEEPRVVDDSRIKKSTRLSGNERQKISEVGKTGNGQAQ